MKKLVSSILAAISALFFGVAAVQAQTFKHPCIPNTLQELDTIKANLDKEPWKSGFAALKADGRSQLTYGMGGPFEVVKRNPNENLWPWRGDMIAINNLARMWFFTGNEAYAQKARDILIAWATTHKVFGGNESGLDLGDYALAYGGGASILRGTWPGWTQQDTLTVQNYFRNVLWPATAAPYKISGPANKGSLNLAAGAVIAVFCDDTAMFNHVVDVFRNYPGAGLPNILATGQMGETGRDMGHGFNDLYARTVTAEILWKQGVDVFSESDNRLLAAGEYHARNTSSPADTPFVPYGTVDYNYYANSGAITSQDRGAYYLLQNAYKNRLGQPTPWIDRKLQEQGIHGGNFMFAKTVDFSTATPPSADPRPPVSPASSGLTLTTLGTQTAGRSASYSNGVWTVTGLGGGVWTDGVDDCQLAYTPMTGDCAMVAQVTSVTYSGNQNGKMGLMIRDNLIGTVSQRSWISITPTASNGNLIEARSTGWTATWGGSNWARRSQGLPLPLPYWLKVERKGTVITSYTSQDGTSWSPTVSSEFGNLPSTVYVGLFVSSGNATPNTGTFANVAFTGGTGGLVTTPPAPAAMLASGSAKAITLRWLPSFGATGYDILRSTTSGSGYTVIASDLTAEKTSYVDTAAAADTTYYYVARAKNSAGTSGNSPEFSSARIPVPLIHLVFDGTPTDNANNSTNAASAFDQNFGSFWFNGTPTGWLQYDFGANSAQVIKRYTMISAPLIPARDPKDWQLQGSNDGTNWTTLDTQTDQTFAWRTQLRIFDIPNTTAYRYYRLNMTANNGDASFLHLAEFGLWGDSGRVLQSGIYVLASRVSNKPMDATDSANGTPVVQRTFEGDDTQQWNVAWQGDGWYRATNVSAGKVLDNGGTSSTSANLVIQPSNGGASQLWKLIPDADGFYQIESGNSGLIADVQGNSAADGANVIQSTANGSDSQQWRSGPSVMPRPIPPAPNGLAGSAVSISQINLSWTVSPGAISYQIKRSITSGGPYTTVATGVNVANYADTGLSADTTYYYVVSALNGSGESANSTQASATTLAAPPDAPAAVTAILGTNSVTLNWTASGGATGYDIKRATTSGGPYTTIATGVTSTSYADTSISHDSTYYYVVVATNANGTGPDSTEITVGAGTLLAHLKFDETSGIVAPDSSGRGQNGTLVNGATFAPALFDNGLNLPATALQHATIPAGIASGLTDFTIATWIKVNAFATWQRIFDFGTGTGTNMFLSAQGPAGAGRPRFSIRTATVPEQTLDSSIALTAGAWTHIAVTRTGNTVRLYINGSLAGSGTITLNPSDLGFTTQNYLGKSQFTDPYLNATLDDFRLYANALSQAELTTLANPFAGAPTRLVAIAGDTQTTLTWSPNATNTYTVKRATTSGGPYTTLATGVTSLTYTDTGLTNGTTYYYVVSGSNAQGSGPDSVEASVTPNTLGLHLRFDESSGTVAFDSSSRGRNATLVNGPTFSAGRINNGLSLASASSQYATLPSGIVSGLTDFTVSTWVKVNTFATWQRIFDFGTGTNNYMFLTTQYTPTAPNNAKLRFGIRTPSVGEQNVSGTGIALPTGAWAHVAVVRSGTTVSIYVNGALAGSNTIALNPADLGTTTLNYLGKSQFNDPYLNGSLDDFRLYSQAMSASQITELSTVLPAPAGLAATAGNGQVALSWSAVSGNSGYSVKRATVAGGPYTTVQTNLTATSFTDTGVANGTTYYYVVSASNLGGESPNSAEASATPLAPPAVPEGLAAIAGDATVALAWSAASGADSYQVKRATAPGGPYTTLASGVTGLTYTDSAVTNGTTYYYVISGVNPVAESANSAEVSATPLPPVPAAPATLTATPGNSTVALAWSAADGAESYNVKRATNSGGPYATLVSGLTATTYNDTSAVNETTYYYLVTATNLGGEGEASPEVSATPVTPPVAPAGLAATSGDASATLTWNSVAGASGYRLKRATTSGGPYALVTESTGTSFADTGLTNGMTYYYVVSAYNAGGESANSTQVSAEPQAVPDAPTGLAATAASSSKINLAWNTVSGANSYAVKRATTTGGPYTTLATGLTATSFNDTGLTSATTYYYVVTATSNGGESVTSTEASATTSDLRVSLAFDETSGTTATDSAGDGYHATLVNGPLFAPGTLGNAVDLDGTNDHLTLPTGVLNGLTNFSISVWVKPDTVTNWSRVFDFGTGTTVNMFLTPKNAANGKVRFAITTGGGAGEQKIDGQAALTAGAWSHVVITWSGNTGILYVNGVEVGRNSAMTLNPSSLGATNLNYLGRSQYPDPYFDGRIDDFRLYSRALGAAEISAATAAQMPLASVSGLQATAASSAQINLSWTANPNATSYNVKRATTPGGPYTTLATGVTATSYSSSGLNAGATYYYVVSATNAGGEGTNSAETGATTFPAAPATLTAIAASSTQLNLTWSASTGATSYTVKRSATSGGAYTTLATGVTATSYSDTGLTAGATWYYVVSASNTGESVDSTEASATTLAETPSGLAATVVSSSAIDLSWNATAGATGYDVKRSTSAGGPFDTIASAVTATAFSDSGLNAATTYHYVVAATNAAGTSPDSASVNATTLPLPPATPAGLVATPGIGQVSLTWSAVSGATGYTVKRATVSGGSYTVVASDLASPSYTDTGLTNGTTYYYVVNATNTGGTSADSSEVSAAPSGLPSPWVTADIGTTGLAGSAEFASDAYTVNGAGSLGGTTDGFRYLYQPLSADGSIIARISTLEDTGSSARVGIMIRDTLAANSRMAALSVTGSGAYKWMRRTTTGGNVSNTNSSSGTAPNIWVRLVRVGNTITASKSTNGTSWTTIGSATVTMASSCYIGLAVSSGSTTTLNTSVFDNVTATP
jgi:fibronectin type 3 domain-containing protein/regulation of enolase protein 1 (concanavalin A-like superfamily)